VDGHEVLIIGAGPAGIAAAIQLDRYNMEPLILEQNEIGGLLRNAHLVENYPGFPEGISGIELAALFKAQVKNAGIKVTFEKVLNLEYKEKVFFAQTEQRVITSDMVVIASGTKPLRLSSIPISSDITEHVFYEVYPLRKVNNKKIAIIGAGDAAFDYALNLSRKNEVIIINRRDDIKCLPLLWERSMKSERITYMNNMTVKEIVKKDKHALIACIDNDSNEEKQVEADYVIAAIGREPGLDFLSDKLKKILATLVKMNKLYMVGDARNGIYRQTAISVGDGIRAAMEIYRNRRR
jgi:thioredoxin reductase (NADPH)